MTIAKRLLFLLAVPLVALMALGIFTRFQLSRVETQTRFIAVTQIGSLAALGNISRTLPELRVNVRSYLLATNQEQQASARSAFDAGDKKLDQLLREYGDTLISDEQDRRQFGDYRRLSAQWITQAKQVMELAKEGHREQALAFLNGPTAELGSRLGTTASEWIEHNEELASAAKKSTFETLDEARWKMLLANTAAILLTGLLGFLTFRRIVRPVQALETSVKTIAAGDYSKEVPFTAATDETGGLARSIDVLKQGAAAMDEQRWVKSSASRLTGEVQGATSLAQFGERLLSGLVPLLGGGAGGFYVVEKEAGRLRRLASYGLADSGSSEEAFSPGEGLVGQCARERKPIALTSLPLDYLRLSSGLGGAAPAQATAWPLLSRETLLSVLEVASFRAFSSREKALLEELLPVVALSLEVLQRNLRTQELLAQTQEQARQLEEQTEELTQSLE